MFWPPPSTLCPYAYIVNFPKLKKNKTHERNLIENFQRNCFSNSMKSLHVELKIDQISQFWRSITREIFLPSPMKWHVYPRQLSEFSSRSGRTFICNSMTSNTSSCSNPLPVAYSNTSVTPHRHNFLKLSDLLCEKNVKKVLKSFFKFFIISKKSNPHIGSSFQ